MGEGGRPGWVKGEPGVGMTASSAVLGLDVYRALSLLVSASIVTDEEVFAQFKEDSRKQYL